MDMEFVTRWNTSTFAATLDIIPWQDSGKSPKRTCYTLIAALADVVTLLVLDQCRVKTTLVFISLQTRTSDARIILEQPRTGGLVAIVELQDKNASLISVV